MGLLFQKISHLFWSEADFEGFSWQCRVRGHLWCQRWMKGQTSLRRVSVFVFACFLSPAARLVWKVCVSVRTMLVLLCLEKNVIFLAVIIHTHRHGGCHVWHIIACCAATVAYFELFYNTLCFWDTPAPACDWSQHFPHLFVFRISSKKSGVREEKWSKFHLQIIRQFYYFFNSTLFHLLNRCFRAGVVSRDQS